MATTMAASALALPAATSSSSSSVRAAKLGLRPASSGSLVRCSSNDVGAEQSRAESAEMSAPRRLSALMVPMLAAAVVVGGVQPAVQASEWNKFLVSVDYNETPPSDDKYKGLLEKMKERRAAREKKPPTVQAEETKSDEESFSFSSLFSPAPTAPAPSKEISAPAPAVAEPSPVQEVVAPVVTDENQKSHGFLPLFLAQLLVLIATVGGGYGLITTPDSKWEESQKTVEGYVSKATAVVQDSWTTAEPLATQAQQKASQFAEAVKPYVIKAWEVSKPLAAKAVEASKPILKGAQTKAVQLFQQATSDKQ